MSCIYFSCNFCAMTSSIARQISPPACCLIRAICSGVINWAATTRSTSFSRPSESCIMTNSPCFNEASAESKVNNKNSSKDIIKFTRIFVTTNILVIKYA